jgi:hypothetical protein
MLQNILKDLIGQGSHAEKQENFGAPMHGKK